MSAVAITRSRVVPHDIAPDAGIPHERRYPLHRRILCNEINEMTCRTMGNVHDRFYKKYPTVTGGAARQAPAYR